MGKYPYFPSIISKWVKAQTHKEISTPTSPASGYLKLYFKNDGKLYKLNSSGVESTTGADDLSAYATLASPTFTGVVTIPNVPNLETAVVANTAKVSLDDNSVTLAKLAHGTADKALGFDGSGNPAEITVGGGAEYSEVTTAGTFTPTTQTGNTKVTVDNRDLTAGSVDINVDGTSISNSSSGTTVKLVNPSSSLSVTTNDEGYDISTAIYEAGFDQYFSIASQSTAPEDVSFKPDGTKMYVVGSTTDKVFQYSLSTAWDLSTASYDSVSFSSLSQTNKPQGISLKSDGTKMYIVGETNPDTIFQYTLSTAWDLSTASYDSVSLDVSSQDTDCRTVEFKSDGTKMYLFGDSNNKIFQYTLSTAWDLSTASYDSVSYTFTADSSPRGFSFNDSGVTLLMIGSTSKKIYEYSLSTAWDASTLSYTGRSISTSAQGNLTYGIAVYGNNAFTSEMANDRINKYSLMSGGTLDGGLNFTLSEAGDVNGIFVNPDGTKMYIVSYSTNLVYQYSLSTAWDLSTASYDSVSFSVASQDSTAEGIFLNSDGTKMYIIGATSNKVFQYSLSTAWDLSTASYDSVSLSYSAQVTSDVRAMTMSNDGLKLIIAKSSTDTMYQYSLGTAWDLSTASYDSISLVTSGMFTDTIKDIGISDDGTKLFQFGYRTVYELIMSTPFDISTASYNSVSYYVSFASNSRGLSFQSTGEKLMLMFPSKVYQVSTVGGFAGTTRISVG